MTSVLIVDDKKEVRASLKRLLEREGFRVRSAGNGEDAVMQQRQDPASVITLDMKMPVLDGLETARRIREFDEAVSFVGVTGFSEEYVPKAEELEFTGWIDKPVLSARKEELLISTVHKAVSDNHERCLGNAISTLASEVGNVDMDLLVDEVRKLTRALETLPPSEITRRIGNSEFNPLAMLLATAMIVRDSGIEPNTFSRIFLGEMGEIPGLAKRLQQIRIAKLADAFAADMRRFAELMEDDDQ